MNMNQEINKKRYIIAWEDQFLWLVMFLIVIALVILLIKMQVGG